MTGGSQQLRRYRIARRAGAAIADACAASGITAGEARLIEVEDAKSPPPAEAYQPLGAAYCAACARSLCGCPDLAWTGLVPANSHSGATA